MNLQILEKAQFDLLFNNSNDFVTLLKKADNDYQIIYVNKKMHSYFRKDLIGKNLTDLVPQDRCSTLINHYNLAICKKQQIDFLEYFEKNSDLRKYRFSVLPIIHNDSNYLLVFAKKIPIESNVEKELRLSNGLSNFKRVIQSAAEISITDTEGTIIDVNDQFVERTGYSREELIGNNHSIINSRYHTDEFFNNLWSTVLNGEIWRGEICNRTKHGTLYWVDTTIIPLFDENGNIHQIISVNFDITEKKRMLTELRNVERMFRMITENTNDLIVITNEDGIILYVSNAYERKLGYKEDELIGQFYTKTLSKESKEIWNNELLNIEFSANSKIELIHESKDGKQLWTECNYTAVKDYIRNRGTQIIMVAREITERKEFENKLLFLAYHDSLTHLPNRRYLQKEFPYIIEKAKSLKQSIAVLYVDGDNFKAVNDRFGHDVGDEFINEFGKSLSRSVRSNDLVVRIGGDEFVIVLTGLDRNEVKREEQVKQIIYRIHEVLKIGWTINDHLFTPTASIGVAFYPDHGVKLNDLLECSDKALYDIKMDSNDKFKFYDKKEI
ncbi:MAG: diguanylate cyclase [Lysinibacillus sp.]|nr:diguanylate cyclase [Lysinibacillus sp.]